MAYGFIDANAGTAIDYTYGDANGNLTADKNKNISSIVYNHLNLPHTITIAQGANTGTINFAYDANGVKQRKLTVLNGPGIRPNPYIVEYAGGYVYEGNQGVVTDLQYFDQEQGYVKPVSVGSTTFQYVYQYRDYLGNSRLAYTDSDPGTGVTLTKIEENNYDAFGLKHQGYNNVISSAGNSRAQALKYNGKELQNDFGLDWYDYGARFYDAALGRWFVMDPLAEKSRRWSQYVYGFDNPIRFIDPDGNWPILPYTFSTGILKAGLIAMNAITAGAVKSDIILDGASGKNKNINVPAGIEMKNSKGDVVGDSKDVNYVKKSTPTLKIEFEAFQGATKVMDAMGKFADKHPDSKESVNDKLTYDRNTKTSKEERELVMPEEEPSKPQTEGNFDIINKDGSHSFDTYYGKTDSTVKYDKYTNEGKTVIPDPY